MKQHLDPSKLRTQRQSRDLPTINGIRCSTEVASWFEALNDADKEKVAVKLEMLAQAGHTLRRPHCGILEERKGERLGDVSLLELNCGKTIRIGYTFEVRQPVLLSAGDKRGVSMNVFYRQLIAESLTALTDLRMSTSPVEVGIGL